MSESHPFRGSHIYKCMGVTHTQLGLRMHAHMHPSKWHSQVSLSHAHRCLLHKQTHIHLPTRLSFTQDWVSYTQLWESLIHKHTHTHPINNTQDVVQSHSGMRALPFRYTHTHVEISSTMWARLICAHPLTPTHVHARGHTHTLSRSGSLPCSKSHIHVCLGFIHTHPHQYSYTYRQVYITYVQWLRCACVDRDTHTHVHTHLCAQRQMCLTHTEESHVQGSESGMHTQSRLCTQSGVFVHKIHTQWCLTQTYARVSHIWGCHTHTQCISHIHRGVTQTRVSHTQRCLTQVQFTRILQSDTHMGQVVHSAGCCRDTCTWGCVTQTWMFHTCWGVSHDVFQAKWISHTWVCVTNTHRVSDIRSCLTLTQTRVSPNAQRVSQTHRVIHAVLQAHTVSHTPDTQALHTHTRVSDTQCLTCFGHT